MQQHPTRAIKPGTPSSPPHPIKFSLPLSRPAPLVSFYIAKSDGGWALHVMITSYDDMDNTESKWERKCRMLAHLVRPRPA